MYANHLASPPLVDTGDGGVNLSNMADSHSPHELFNLVDHKFIRTRQAILKILTICLVFADLINLKRKTDRTEYWAIFARS